MRVICKGYKNCPERSFCVHAKTHEFTDNGVNYYMSCTSVESENYNDSNCVCSHIFLREEKLKKLQG